MRPIALTPELHKLIDNSTQKEVSTIKLAPIERLPLYEGDTWWAGRYGGAGKVVKELRHIHHDLRTGSTPELHDRKRELINFLRTQYPRVAVELELTKGQNSTSVGEFAADPSDQASRWREFHDGFMLLANEEDRIVRASMKDDYLRAYCEYRREAEILHERGKPEQGRFCLLNMPECGIWHYSSGVSENFQERFRALAARTGLALGCPKGTDPEEFWLHSLFQNLLENKSTLLFAAKKGEGGMIQRVCEASATFCSRLERKGLEPLNRANGSVGSQRLIDKINEQEKAKPRFGNLYPHLLAADNFEKANTGQGKSSKALRNLRKIRGRKRLANEAMMGAFYATTPQEKERNEALQSLLDEVAHKGNSYAERHEPVLRGIGLSTGQPQIGPIEPIREAHGPRDFSTNRRVPAAAQEFDKIVGKWMHEAHLKLEQKSSPRRGRTPTLPSTVYARIVERTDRAKKGGNGRFPLQEVLSEKVWGEISVFNQKGGTHARAILSWKSAANHPKFKRDIHYRFNRAEIYFRKHYLAH